MPNVAASMATLVLGWCCVVIKHFSYATRHSSSPTVTEMLFVFVFSLFFFVWLACNPYNLIVTHGTFGEMQLLFVFVFAFFSFGG